MTRPAQTGLRGQSVLEKRYYYQSFTRLVDLIRLFRGQERFLIPRTMILHREQSRGHGQPRRPRRRSVTRTREGGGSGRRPGERGA